MQKTPPPASRRWLSEDLSALIRAQAKEEGKESQIFDLVIVGSGYGGAMAAAELAGCTDSECKPLRICLLERGKEYTPGMFPSSVAELPNHLRFRTTKAKKPTGKRSALLDFRLGTDVNALVANGLGGGSLINGGVMAKPQWKDFQNSKYPASLTTALDDAYLENVKSRLGAKCDVNGQTVDNTIELHASVNCPAGLKKTKALNSLSPGEFSLAPVTISMTDDLPNLSACTLCGDCMTGCNAGAKISLDTNLLLEAAKEGLKIYTGASVMHVTREADEDLWSVNVVYTDESLRLRGDPLVIKARKVILAAGTFGSPEILMRSSALSPTLGLSSRLGQSFSCNGDNLAAAYKTKLPTHAAADEHTTFANRNVGPTITGILEMTAKDGNGFLVQEFAVPAPIKRLFEESLTTSAFLHSVPNADSEEHVPASPGSNTPDPCAIDPGAIEHSMVLGLIGHDTANGILRVSAQVDPTLTDACEGALQVDWAEARHGSQLESAYDTLIETVAKNRLLQNDGRILPNPLWRMLPEKMEMLVTQGRGPVLTVHPLGGCPMGDDAKNGVVDEFGRVFDANAPDPRTCFGSLLVLDGSILPGSLGANPALTIAATAMRACQHMRNEWNWKQGTKGQKPIAERPKYRSLDDCQPQHTDKEKDKDTEIEIIERLSGRVELLFNEHFMAEMTLCYEPFPLKSLSSHLYRKMTIREASGKIPSQLRLYQMDEWDQSRLRFAHETQREVAAVFVAELQGNMYPFNRHPSLAFPRTLRAWLTWLVTRGLRDGIQRLQDKCSGLVTRKFNFLETIKDSWRLASRAGEVRTLIYDLRLGKVSKNSEKLNIQLGDVICGAKRLTYAWRTTPLEQLMELSVTKFPGMPSGASPVLKLDNRFIAEQGIPLVRITKQRDQVNALFDLASFGFYMTRLMLGMHLWSFRKPDRGAGRQPTLLPGIVDGLPLPEVTEIDLDEDWKARPVRVRLTRYRGKHADSKTGRVAADQYPLVFIHGYSAGGNTFTHNAIDLPMARYFHDQGRDIWVLDLRTSPGMPSAERAWRFEDAALADIPVAIAHILDVTGAAKVDVFAHCIGAIMISMALLTDSSTIGEATRYAGQTDLLGRRRYLTELDPLPTRIRRLVLCQKGPALVYTDENVFRAYLMRSLQKLLLPDDFQFRSKANPGIAEQLMDRLLAALPYPKDELARENPWWPFTRTPWVGFRHRMDFLYGRDFNLCNIPKKTLNAIEDLFGPLNLDTVAQAIHFATHNRITNWSGNSVFVTPKRMAQRWGHIEKTFSIHGEDNGLVDVETLNVMQDLMDASGLSNKYEKHAFPGFGHQDCLIGKNACHVFQHVESFLK